MIIPKFNFPFYGIIVVLSVLIGMGYIFLNIKKERFNNKQVSLYFIMYISFAFVFGKMYTVLIYGEKNFMEAGLSAYGGLVGVIIASIIFEKILPTDKKIIKYSILSLPLVYGISKIACFIAGCCGGIPYDGLFKVKYTNMLNIWQFPVQLLEVIVSLAIFVICQLCNKNKNINYIVLILVFVSKFLMDFLRYEHVETLITRNQIFSIIMLLITIIVYIYNKKIFTLKKSK